MRMLLVCVIALACMLALGTMLSIPPAHGRTSSLAQAPATRPAAPARRPPAAAQPVRPASQPQPGNVPRPPQTGQTPGPWDNDLLLYRGIGNEFRKIDTWPRGGVPSIIRDKNGRLIAAFQWFPEKDLQAFDRVALRYSTDDGHTWTQPKTIDIAQFPEDLMRPFDPTLALAPDGKVRLYFSSRSLKDHRSKVATHSATSDDGEHFTFEAGMRFGIDDHNVIDCAVVCLKDVWHYFAPEDGPSTPRGVGYHATSPDGLKFERQADVQVDGHKRWLGCVSVEGNALRFYGTDDGARPGDKNSPRIWSAVSSDGATWKLDGGIAVEGVDAGVALTKDGDRIVIATGPPRPGTPSARRPRPPLPPATHPR